MRGHRTTSSAKHRSSTQLRKFKRQTTQQTETIFTNQSRRLVVSGNAKPLNRVINRRTWLWKSNEMMFVMKTRKVDNTTLSSYKPITLNSYIGGTMERTQLKCIIDSLVITWQMDKNQEGLSEQR